LTAVLQDYARRCSIEIDRLEFGFDVHARTAHDNEDPNSDVWRALHQHPESGAKVIGLQLEGAAWSDQGQLEEQKVGELHQLMPVVHVNPRRR
jgi:hypothetical protein